MSRNNHKESGSATLEVLILTPLLFVLMNVAIYAGQVRIAHSMVRSAAQEAARYASIERTGFNAHFQSFGTGGTIPTIQGLSCDNPDFHWKGVDPYVPGAVGNAPGTKAQITVSVSCDVPIRMVSALGVAKYVHITEVATTVIDTYRARK